MRQRYSLAGGFFVLLFVRARGLIRNRQKFK